MPGPLMLDAVFVELPPRNLRLSSHLAFAPRSSSVWTAETPGKPPPPTITWAIPDAAQDRVKVGQNERAMEPCIWRRAADRALVLFDGGSLAGHVDARPTHAMNPGYQGYGYAVNSCRVPVG